MRIESLGLRTDFMFYRFFSELIDRSDRVVVRTPDNPSFHWGNLIVYPEGPSGNDYQRWTRDFKEEFDELPLVRHMTFTWDSVSSRTDTREFVREGFEYGATTVLVAEGSLSPQYPNREVDLKIAQSDDDWRGISEFHIRLNPLGQDVDEYRKVAEQQFAEYRRMTKQGFGNWYFATFENRIVADLGLFDEDGVARFQNIETAPEWRRRGIAQTLMAFAADSSRAKTFVVQADSDDSVVDLYKSLGFTARETLEDLCWYK